MMVEMVTQNTRRNQQKTVVGTLGLLLHNGGVVRRFFFLCNLQIAKTTSQNNLGVFCEESLPFGCLHSILIDLLIPFLILCRPF